MKRVFDAGFRRSGAVLRLCPITLALAFIITDSAWGQCESGKLLPSDGEPGDNFGTSVAASADGISALIGAPRHSPDGAAYVFVHSGSSWTQQVKLTPSNAPGGLFGFSVNLSADLLVVGAPFDGFTAGSAYIFRRHTSGMWIEEAELTASDGNTNDQFGRSVATNGEVAVIGQRRRTAPNEQETNDETCI